jgi:acyl-CoA thioesterase-2
MPNIPPPGELEDDLNTVARFNSQRSDAMQIPDRPRPFEMRSVFPPGSAQWQQERYWNPVWIRFSAAVERGDDALARSLLAYASDMGMVSTALLPHMGSFARSEVQIGPRAVDSSSDRD